MTLLFLGNSGDVRGELGSPSEAEYSANDLSRARERATNLVNSYIEVAYSTQIPFTASGDVPFILNSVANDLAVYYAKRSKHPGPAPLTEDVKTEYYDKSIKVLEEIRDGKLEIPELSSTKGDKIIGNRSSYTPTFDVDEIESQSPDQDLIDDIVDERNT